MKKGAIVGIVIVVLIIGIFAYRSFVPPSFQIISSDASHTGTYSFGGVQNTFGNGSITQGGRAGWELAVNLNSDGTTTFNLNKNGKFVKQLAVA